jgi:hypothetical protein
MLFIIKNASQKHYNLDPAVKPRDDGVELAVVAMNMGFIQQSPRAAESRIAGLGLQ